MSPAKSSVVEMTVVESPKAGLPTTLEIAARFPYSHRSTTAIYFSKPIPKGAFLTACTFSLQAHSSIRKESKY